MSQKLDHDEFWLPSEFLTDDDLLMDYKTEHFLDNGRGGIPYGFGFNSGFNSGLCSPVKSPNGSTETESDEDDFISGITRNLKKTALDYPAKGRNMYGSPQSALAGYCFSNAPSPTEAKTAVGWDLLYAAAEEVAKMKMVEELATIQSHKFHQQQQKLPPLRVNCPVSPFHPYKSQNEARLAYLQLQTAHFQRMKQQQNQMMRKVAPANTTSEFHFQNVARTSPFVKLPETWPSLQQSIPQRRVNSNQPVNAMATVFLGENGLKKERNGTGVFLPRRIGSNPAETRRKPVGFLPEDAPYYTRVNSKPMIPNLRKLSAPAMSNQELRLPHDWSY